MPGAPTSFWLVGMAFNLLAMASTYSNSATARHNMCKTQGIQLVFVGCHVGHGRSWTVNSLCEMDL